MRLITQRSQVQILPPLQVKVQVRGPFSLRGGRASGVDVRRMYAVVVAGRRRMGADRGSLWSCAVRPTSSRATSDTGLLLQKPCIGGD